jgi:hypothetical protein
MTQLGEEITRYAILSQVADQINSCHNGLLSIEHDGPTDVTNYISLFTASHITSMTR